MIFGRTEEGIVKALEIKKDIGDEVIEILKKFPAIIDAKKKEENEKIYPCPFCNKEISLKLLKSKLFLSI